MSSNYLYSSLPTFSQSPTKSLTVDATAGGVAFAAPTNVGAQIWFDVQDADVMATFDGATAPTSSVGHRLSAGEKYRLQAGDAVKAKFIRQGAVNARIQYSEVV